ncbi:putative ribonuclease H-like domain-containing protein [Tanacetum coccineum]
MSTPATAENEINKKNDVKGRGLLLMALPNEHQLTFSQYPDAKSMFVAIKTRFGGNAATKKTQKTLLKQQYENFNATSAESLDSIFNRLQKIVIVWMNKPEVKTMSIDDLYNNFKIVEQKVKKTVGTSSGGQKLAFMTALSSSSTNDANTTCPQVSAASPSVNAASPQVCTASVSDNIMYAFMVENPNGSNVLHQDLKKIHEDDLEAMDLKWQLSLLSVRAKNYYQRTGKKIFINANDIVGYDKSKVECYNYHKLGHFSRECKAPRSKEGQFRNQDNTIKQGNNEDTSSKAMLAIDGVDLTSLIFFITGLDEFKEPEFKGYGPEDSMQESNVVGKQQLDDKGFVDSGCSRHMSGNIAYLSDFKEFDRGYVAFGEGAYGGRITGKGTLKTDNLDFEDLPDENQILLKIPRKDNMYSFDMKNIVPKESLTCLVAKATLDESMLWHRRLGHINFKNINKLVNDNLVRGLPTKQFENDQTCVACLKGKQHRASCKSKVLNPITKPLFMLHMDLFGPTFVSSLMHKKYCLVVTDDYSRFTWVFFLTTKDETSEILKSFIKEIENLVDKKVKIIRSDNGTEFKNKVTDDFCREKVTIGTVSNDSAGTSVENSQDCIVMPIWKDTSYFDSPTKDVDNGETKTVNDAQKQVEDSSNNENDEQERFADDSSTKDVNAAGQQVNTASPDVNTGSLKLNVVGPSVNTTSLNEEDSTEEEPEVDLGNITSFYIVPTTPNTRIHKDHPIDNVIGEIEPTSIAKALSDSSWVEAMQEELLQFKLQQVWILVDLPNGKKAIGTKWVFRNKKDERGIMIRNKARLVTQGHRQEEGIDYEEVFALVERIEAIRLFLAYASFMGFLVYQMDVKSAFLYGTIEEEVYVTQPPGFKDPDHPDKVYKVVKALYGLHQAPRAWYETLANYLLSNGFKRGKIDQTLFIKKQKGDILLVQVYVDDIIFGSTNKELCTGFEKLMKDKFQMSSMGELTFFLGLQVQQKEDGIFISQDKYVAEILKKFNYSDVEVLLQLSIDLEKTLVNRMEMLRCSDVDIWQCKKKTMVATSITEAEYVVAASCCGQYWNIPNNGKVPDYADTGLLWSLSVFIRSTVIWERVHNFQLGIESYQQKVNLTAPTMTFPGIEDHEMFSIIYEPVYGFIYKNSKKEKRVMRHSEIHMFCDATLYRVLEGLKSYNNDVKYGYVQKDLTKDETEYLKLFEEEIEERLKHRRQMRRWEMYVNGRPLGPRRERPE